MLPLWCIPGLHPAAKCDLLEPIALQNLEIYFYIIKLQTPELQLGLSLLLTLSKKEVDPPLTRVLLTRPEEIFLTQGKKFKNLTFIGEISQIQPQTINGWPDTSHNKLTQPDPGQKFLTWTHHYAIVPQLVLCQLRLSYLGLILTRVIWVWLDCQSK